MRNDAADSVRRARGEWGERVVGLLGCLRLSVCVRCAAVCVCWCGRGPAL